MNFISPVFSVHLMRNSQHGKGKQTAYCLSGSGSNLVKIHLLKLKFSFSLLLSSINSYILLSVVKYVKVVRFNKEDGILW